MALTNDPDTCWIAGTNRTITRREWEALARMLEVKRVALPSVAPAEEKFVHSGRYVVSAIASLYKGGRYIETFLRNITRQTYFDRSELIIIDAASPENEAEVILRYQRKFPNIVYYRASERIGIYEAWNLGVGLARGRYLTNVNMDDLRRQDSFELQAKALIAILPPISFTRTFIIASTIRSILIRWHASVSKVSFRMHAAEHVGIQRSP